MVWSLAARVRAGCREVGCYMPGYLDRMVSASSNGDVAGWQHFARIVVHSLKSTTQFITRGAPSFALLAKGGRF
jgi:hypothetical protein